MAGFTAYAEAKLLEHAFKIANFPQPGNITVALYTTLPNTETGVGGVEVSGGSYARQTVNAWTKTGSSPTQVANTNVVTFPVPSADWGLVVGFAVFWDGVACGIESLTNPKYINIDDDVTWPAGLLIVRLN